MNLPSEERWLAPAGTSDPGDRRESGFHGLPEARIGTGSVPA